MAQLSAPKSSSLVTIRRKAAFGDVLMATPLAKRFADFGLTVRFDTSISCAPALDNLPFMNVVTDEVMPAVNLDNTYEKNLNRKRKSVGEMFFDAAALELRRHGIPEKALNLRPHMVLTKEEISAAVSRMAKMPRPWTVFVRRSVAWPSRTLHECAFMDVIRALPGSVFVGIPDAIAIDGAVGNVMVTDWARTFREFCAVIACCDLVITPDTGPMHVAAALGKPIVVLEQSIAIDRRLNDQTDYLRVPPDVKCSPCNEFACVIPGMKSAPPCQWVNPSAILSAAATKLDTLTNGLVSAIIPVYKDTPRLHRCLEAVRHQVYETVVALDGDCVPVKIPSGSDVRTIPCPGTRLGYGKNCQRAVRRTYGEYLLFLNDDCYLDGIAVASMKAVLKNNADVAVVGALLRYPDGKIQHAGMFRGTAGYGHIDHQKVIQSIRVQTEMECVTFAAALVRRSAFFQVGGFDEEYDCYSEDVDLCMKLRRAGWKVVYNPQATGIHEESQSTTTEKNKMLAASHAILRRKWGAFFSGNPLGKLGTNFAGTQ
jgi:GT2 family glycosyltransferase